MTPAETGLAAFNRHWQARLERYYAQARPPWWEPGLVLTAQVHVEHERFLPVHPYRLALHGTLDAVLEERGLPRLGKPAGEYHSIAQWWAGLPPALAGEVAVPSDRVVELACAIAAPARFGTKAGRYPEQRDWVQAIARPVRALDIGCGTGQGTWELAGWLPTGSRVAGLTREPLEVWMANGRTTPHLHSADWAYPDAAPGREVTIHVGTLEDPPIDGPFDLIVCNGLVGGPAFRHPQLFQRAIDAFDRLLAPGARLILGDTFHDGHAPAVQAFHDMLQQHRQPAATTGRSVLYRW